MLYNNEDVLGFLPHRNPFLFLDSVEEVNSPEYNLKDPRSECAKCVGATIKGHFEVKNDLEILKGHFPGYPILPGVVQVEMMGQLCPFIYKKVFEKTIDLYDIKVQLLGVEKARFKKPVLPGERLIIVNELKKVRGIFQTHECKVFSQNESLISYSEVFASIEFIKKEKV